MNINILYECGVIPSRWCQHQWALFISIKKVLGRMEKNIFEI